MPKQLTYKLGKLAPKRVRSFVMRYVLPYSLSMRVQRWGAVKVRRPKTLYERGAKNLETKLWGGFSEQALADLEALKSNPQTSPREIHDAALAIARWQASRGDFSAAHQNAVLARVAYPLPTDTLQILLEAQCLLVSGEWERARALLEVALPANPKAVSLRLCLANTYAVSNAETAVREGKQLEVINHILQANGLTAIGKLDAERALSLDNLGATFAQSSVPRADQPKVSVLIPAYASERTLHIALDSLLRQTWQNLEIIVIDDRSPDGTYALACDYAARDSRVKALQTPLNAGAYVARNLGLRHATGAFVTVHDADDWSHPQKTELQVLDLLRHEQYAANLTDWVRCYQNLYFRGPTRFSSNWVTPNYSSLMIRRDVLDQLGGWDEVRVGADSELMRRLEHGRKGQLHKLLPGVPLAFALDTPSSLTRHATTHVYTLFHGVRRTYHEAATFWLQSKEPKLHSLPGDEHDTTRRAFPAPGFILPDRRENSFDLLFITDFNIVGGAFGSTLNYIQAALRLGLKVGLFQWRRYDLDVRRPLQDQVLQMAQDGSVTIVAPGERVKADTVIVGYPVVLKCAIDLPPEIECQRFVIVTNQMAARLYSGGDVQYDPQEVANTVQRLFGRSPLWVPISELVRGLMKNDGRYQPIHTKTWTPLIDTSTWCQNDARFRGSERRRPVIGRHARDHYTKWPAAAEAVRAAYCADRACEVRLLGGAEVPMALLGKQPTNWVVHAFGSLDAREFLSDLDFYLHFPHEDYIEEFGRAVIEAMAAGVPVILPKVFESTFGEAALYTEPEGVWPLIDKLWRDEQGWLARVEAGRRFVHHHSDWAQFAKRLEDLKAIAGADVSQDRPRSELES